ncbi:MAG: glucosylceramidase [Bacteroidetes bacterium]|nr:glucosylceramidase [Bacteroidota bacterium]MBS1539158.1 glucosylceramidase [Bacteroidota bacterium]
MKKNILISFGSLSIVSSSMLLLIGAACNPNLTSTNSSTQKIVAKVWTTLPDKSALLKVDSQSFSPNKNTSSVITVDSATRYQTMDGFGFALTGGSAQLMMQKLTADVRTNLLRELFLTDNNGIGISYLRISMGSSDLDETVFSYDDMPASQTDPGLTNFNLSVDKLYLIPVLQEIIRLRPDIHLMASPWSAPAWMKSNQNARGGSLNTSNYAVYAAYFVKYVQAMAAAGINIEAVTLQNEPENPDNTPSMLMTAPEEALFVKSYLGPAFQQANLKTKIVVFDHNCDHPQYPISILQDSEAYPYIDGSAFHLYLGDISALSQVQSMFPKKNIYFTEQWTSGKGNFGGDLRWHVRNLIVGASRNWSKNVLEWNLASDENFSPHTDGGCTLCQGALTINSASASITRNVSYYIIAHASKFVPSGSVRIGSNYVDDLYNVAFLTPQGKKVLVVVNDGTANINFTISFRGMYLNSMLPVGAVATYMW